MLNILQSIFRSVSPSGGPDAALIRAASERVVDGTDPRLRAASGYLKVLREPVTRAVEHVIGLVDSLPPDAEISGARFATNTLLRAFFVSVKHLRETVSYSEDVQKFLRHPPPLPDGTIHCLLTLDRSEKGVLGMALRGDSVSKDVAQTVVNFSAHRLVGLAASEGETRRELKKLAFDTLIHVALGKLVDTRDRTQTLEQQRRLLEKKIATLQGGDWGLHALLKPDAPQGSDPHALEQRLAGIEAELLALESDTATLDGQLGNVAATLAAPDEHLRLERTSLTLDSMGVRLEGTAAAGVPAIELLEVVSGDRRRVLLPGYVIRAELLPPRDFLKEAQRRLPGGP